ncbi:MAG TPA: FtsX-like permease family protein [Bacteroidales bacterium]|nr:FtsX-like permease family protein [Bacteroidales bacterium]
MLAIKLAIRNLVGAGFRTFLNVFILSVAYVVIIMQNGFIQGWNKQARHDTIEWEYGQGQYRNEIYDPYDPFTYEDAHGIIPDKLLPSFEKGNIAAVLISQATIYPEGRLKSIMLKGINPGQEVVALPTYKLVAENDEIPAIIGSRMAVDIKANVGDFVLVRWRDANGMFDAVEVIITGVFSTNVPAIDMGQIWIPLKSMQSMIGIENEATIIIIKNETDRELDLEGFDFWDHSDLLADMDELIRGKSIGNAVMYLILLALALLAVFDTQVLSIFRRQKEIGTFIAMGMTRRQVIGVFTVEGTMHAIFALIIGALWGVPTLLKLKQTGFPMPEGIDQMGLPISETIIPAYSMALVIGTVILVTLTTAIVSYMPARKIAKMNPNDAIRGKIQ